MECAQLLSDWSPRSAPLAAVKVWDATSPFSGPSPVTDAASGVHMFFDASSPDVGRRRLRPTVRAKLTGRGCLGAMWQPWPMGCFRASVVST